MAMAGPQNEKDCPMCDGVGSFDPPTPDEPRTPCTFCKGTGKVTVRSTPGGTSPYYPETL